jgi:hypothetical protein
VSLARRRWLLPAALVLAAACVQTTKADTKPLALPSPSSPSTRTGVTLTLGPRPGGGCCLVSSVNPGDEATTVLCFVEIFDEAGQLLSTHLVPPKPAGHRRSSGFEAAPGIERHGYQSIPLGPADGYVSTCRPAAWHGGAPI